MFINENYVAIIFKLINFAALIGLITFFFKKYAKKDILCLIDQEKTTHNELLATQRILESKQHDLDDIIKQEYRACEQFKATIDEWKKVVLDEKNTQEKEQAVLLDNLKQRHAQLVLHKNNTRIQNATLDIAINTLNLSLADNFKTSQAGTDYLDGIIRFMNERASL